MHVDEQGAISLEFTLRGGATLLHDCEGQGALLGLQATGHATLRDAVERLGGKAAAMVSTRNAPWKSIRGPAATD